MAQVNNINLTHLGDGLRTPQLQPREPFSPKREYQSFKIELEPLSKPPIPTLQDEEPMDKLIDSEPISPSKKRVEFIETLLKSPPKPKIQEELKVDAAQVYRRIRERVSPKEFEDFASTVGAFNSGTLDAHSALVRIDAIVNDASLSQEMRQLVHQAMLK
jgi:hypothetical protein